MTGFLQVLILYHKHIEKDTQHRLTHLYKYILTPPVMCSQQLSVLHHWMIRFNKNKFFSCSMKPKEYW